MRPPLAPLVALLLSGCMTTASSRLGYAEAGGVPCRSSEMADTGVDQRDWSNQHFEVMCRGVRYRCSGWINRGYNCRPMTSPRVEKARFQARTRTATTTAGDCRSLESAKAQLACMERMQ